MVKKDDGKITILNEMFRIAREKNKEKKIPDFSRLNKKDLRELREYAKLAGLKVVAHNDENGHFNYFYKDKEGKETVIRVNRFG